MASANFNWAVFNFFFVCRFATAFVGSRVLKWRAGGSQAIISFAGSVAALRGVGQVPVSIWINSTFKFTTLTSLTHIARRISVHCPG